jgi:fumarate hydratase class II
MERLQQQSKKMQTEIEALCKLGKRDEAQATAMRYGQEIAASEDMQAIKNCGEMAQQMMQHMQMGGGAEGKTTHICDSAQNPDDED